MGIDGWLVSCPRWKALIKIILLYLDDFLGIVFSKNIHKCRTMSSALRTQYDPVQYFAVVADSSAYTYDDVSWSAVAGSSLSRGAVYRDLGQIAYWHPTYSVAATVTAPPVSDVRKVARMTTTGVSTAASDQVWISLGTRVKGSPSEQSSAAIPPCPLAQIPGVASIRGGR